MEDNFLSVGRAAKEILETFRVVATKMVNCPKHGDYEQKIYATGRKQACDLCLEEKHKAEIVEEEAIKKREQDILLQERIGEAKLSPRHEGKTIKDYIAETDNQKYIKQQVVEYAKEFMTGHSGRDLAFIGIKGTGKTHLAVALCSHVIKNVGGTARFAKLSEISTMVRESKSYDSKIKESEIIKAFGSYDLLVIDEVGIQTDSKTEQMAINAICNKRYENMKPTIFIGNLEHVEDLIYHLGERIVDRIREDGGQILGFDWESYRKVLR